MKQARFRYALEPLLLTRRWKLDDLLRILAEHNAQLHSLAAEGAALQSQYAAADSLWKAVTQETSAQPVQRFAMHARHLGDLVRQLREHGARMTALAAARDDVIATVVTARRSLDAAEQHRDAMEDRFHRMRMSADFKLADDQWNTLHTGAASHGH
ncbi:hypothetical protein [Massilia sp. TSP1-1-2]|uniref:hypothetical protein n=1 Tax=Massilia sp. TSP1-1-2 TaxID=2804649 RepID=UPI003CF8C2EA